MLSSLSQVARRILERGASAPGPSYDDMGEAFHRLHGQAAPFTMTSVERMYSLHQAADHIAAARVPGDVVECGVWRGGSSMMAALTLAGAGDLRTLWLYDTFEGMTPPTERDRVWSGETAADKLAGERLEAGAVNTWAYATLDDVQANMARTGYPADRVRYVKGPVEQTIPAEAPERISLLRLDTDWYESTRHELEHLWPRLVSGGVLIIDDYGHWQGARQATDEYFADQPLLLHRVDYTGRIAVKP